MLLENLKMNILFICSKNKWRSKTAETIFKNRWPVKSAGTEKGARIRVTSSLIEWSEIIFVMEEKHKERLEGKYEKLLPSKELIVLDIPDVYQYMDEDLIQHFEDAVPFYLEQID